MWRRDCHFRGHHPLTISYDVNFSARLRSDAVCAVCAVAARLFSTTWGLRCIHTACGKDGVKYMYTHWSSTSFFSVLTCFLRPLLERLKHLLDAQLCTLWSLWSNLINLWLHNNKTDSPFQVNFLGHSCWLPANQYHHLESHHDIIGLQLQHAWMHATASWCKRAI